MILSDKDIIEKIEKGELVVRPFLRKNVQPSTLDVCLSKTLRVFDNFKLGVIDPRKGADPTQVVEMGEEGFVIHPGEFVLGSTVEEIEMPLDLAAKLEGRSSLGRLGLVIHATAGYVDPGFSGDLTLEISNISRTPIRIYSEMRIAQLCFYNMSSPVERPYGAPGLGSKYQGQKGPTSSKIWEEFEKK